MPPIRKNGCGKQLPQPKTHTTPADRQAMTTHRAERYTNFPRKAQQTGRSSPPDRYRANIQQEIRFILSTPLLFFLILPHAPQKKQPRPLPAALSAFWRTAKKNSTIAKNAGEGAITFSRNVCGLKKPDTRLSMSLFFDCCGRRTFCVCSVNFQKPVEKLIRICHTKIMHLEGKKFCTICAAK
jgi:hypothetical protein